VSEAAASTVIVWTVGERIRKAREDMGWKQSDLAAELRVDRSTIAGWENNSHTPSYIAIKAVSDVTDKPSWWIEGHDTPPSGGVPTLSDRRSRNRREQARPGSR
jgi:transcriptional regulator with XRE-family HTH domain